MARVCRPPQATSLAIQRSSVASAFELFAGGDMFIGTSIGCPVVTFLPYPSRPWSPRPNCHGKTELSQANQLKVR